MNYAGALLPTIKEKVIWGVISKLIADETVTFFDVCKSFECSIPEFSGGPANTGENYNPLNHLWYYTRHEEAATCKQKFDDCVSGENCK